MVQIHVMRRPCPFCGCSDATVEERNGQTCLFCSACGRFQYNAPKTETGQRPRTVTTIHNGISPSVRCRILERATGRCELCGSGGNLHVSHILSVADGAPLGLTEYELNSEDNLCVMCEECNLGMGAASFNPRLYVALLRRRANVHHG